MTPIISIPCEIEAEHTQIFEIHDVSKKDLQRDNIP